MLMNDYDDDEFSLEDEEDMESAESVTSELNDLQREGEMPLNKVLAMYGDSVYENTLQEVPERGSDSSVTPDPALEIHSSSQSIASDSEDRKLFEVIDLISPNITPTKTRPLLRSVHPQSESDSDCDYTPGVHYWQKKIQVGSDYQAVIPEGLTRYDDAPPYENEDRLLWDPSKLTDEEVEDYLRKSRQPKGSGICSVPTGSHIRDDENALYLLLQCGHNKEEALRRRSIQSPSPTITLWSEEECRGFESGLKVHGKNFRLIQLERVRTRAISELVQFYYFWKRTERHDMFACKNRIEKKKYALHPGATDYMDRFLEEQEKENAKLCSSPSSLLEEVRTPLVSTETAVADISEFENVGSLSINGNGPMSSGLEPESSL